MHTSHNFGTSPGHPDDIQPNKNVLELGSMFLPQPGDPQSVCCEVDARHLGAVFLAVLSAKSLGLPEESPTIGIALHLSSTSYPIVPNNSW